MNKHFYLKHEIMAFNDPRIQNMLRQEGGKAYGAYWYIMEKLSLLPDMEAELKYLKPFATRNFTYPYMMKIVTNFGLFTVTDSCFSPVQLNTKCVAEPQKAEENTAKNSGQNGKKYPDNDVKPGKNAGFSTKNRQTMDKNRDGNESEINCNTPNISDLSNENLQQKENIRDIITTAAKEKEISAAAIDRNDTGVPADTGVSANASVSPFSGGSALHAIRPWQELVDGLCLESSWAEIACMKSGYGGLLSRYFKEAIGFFKQHILLYDKGPSLLNSSDVHQYFANFTAPGSRTSAFLHAELLKLEAVEQSHSLDPYRFEKRIGEQRTYMGCPIPDEAPPRPEENAIWNDRTKQWILPRLRSKAAS